MGSNDFGNLLFACFILVVILVVTFRLLGRKIKRWRSSWRNRTRRRGSARPITNVKLPDKEQIEPQALTLAQWMTRVNDRPYPVGIEGVSGPTKITFVETIVSSWPGQLAIITDKPDASIWGRVPYIITVDDDGEFTAVEATVHALRNEAQQRLIGAKRREWLTILLDDFTKLRQKCSAISELIQLIGAEGRNIKISLILITRNKFGEALGIKGQGGWHENLALISVDRQGRALLKWDGETYQLDTRTISDVPKEPIPYTRWWQQPGTSFTSTSSSRSIRKYTRSSSSLDKDVGIQVPADMDGVLADKVYPRINGTTDSRQSDAVPIEQAKDADVQIPADTRDNMADESYKRINGTSDNKLSDTTVTKQANDLGLPVLRGTADSGQSEAISTEQAAEVRNAGAPAVLTDEALRTLYAAWGSKDKVAALLTGTEANSLQLIEQALAEEAEWSPVEEQFERDHATSRSQIDIREILSHLHEQMNNVKSMLSFHQHVLTYLGDDPFSDINWRDDGVIVDVFSNPVQKLENALRKMIDRVGDTVNDRNIPTPMWEKMQLWLKKIHSWDSTGTAVALLRLRDVAVNNQTEMEEIKNYISRERYLEVRNAAKEVERLLCIYEVHRAIDQTRSINERISSFITSKGTEYGILQDKNGYIEIYEVGEIVQEIVSDFSDRAKQANIEIRMKDTTRGVILKLPRADLRKALGNLLDNAIKYTGKLSPNSGHTTTWIDIRISSDPHKVSIIFESWGIPITLEEKEGQLMFKFGYRGFFSHKMGIEGTGTGLADVYNFARGNGGSVTFDSMPVSKTTEEILPVTSTVTLILPYSNS